MKFSHSAGQSIFHSWTYIAVSDENNIYFYEEITIDGAIFWLAFGAKHLACGGKIIIKK